MTQRVALSTHLYEIIKAEVRSGRFLPGQPISAAMYARRCSASIIPVREALNRLVGERLVEMWDHDGFHAPHISETALRDLYETQFGLLVWAWEHVPRTALRQDIAYDAHEPSAAIETLFGKLADGAGNRELRWMLVNTLDRLHAFSRTKVNVAEDWCEVCDFLIDHWQHGTSSSFKHALRVYHRRRMVLVPKLIEHVHQSRMTS